MIEFKIVDTFKNFLDRLPGTVNGIEPKFDSGDIVYCSENAVLYRVGNMGSYTNGAIVDISDSQLSNSAGSFYDDKIFYRNKTNFYYWDSTSSLFHSISEVSSSDLDLKADKDLINVLDANFKDKFQSAVQSSEQYLSTKGGTMTGNLVGKANADDTSQVRNIALTDTTPSSVPNGTIVGVYE